MSQLAAIPVLYAALSPEKGTSAEVGVTLPGTYEIPIENEQKRKIVTHRIGIPVASQGPPSDAMMLATESELGDGMYRLQIMLNNGDELVDARQIAARFHRFSIDDIAVAVGPKSIHLFSTLRNMSARIGPARPWMTRMFVETSVCAVDVRRGRIWTLSMQMITVRDLQSLGIISSRKDTFDGQQEPIGVVAMTNGCEAVVASRHVDTKNISLYWLKADALSGNIEKNLLDKDLFTVEGNVVLGVGTMAMMVCSHLGQRFIYIVNAEDEVTVRHWKIPPTWRANFEKGIRIKLNGSVHYNGIQTYMIPFISTDNRIGYITCMSECEVAKIDTFGIPKGTTCTHVVISPMVETITTRRLVVLVNGHFANGVLSRLDQEAQAACHKENMKLVSETGSTYTVGRIAAYKRKHEMDKTEIAAKDKQITELQKTLETITEEKMKETVARKTIMKELDEVRKCLTDITMELANSKSKRIEDIGGIKKEVYDEQVALRKKAEVQCDAAVVARARAEKLRDEAEERYRSIKSKKADVDSEIDSLMKKVKKQASQIQALQKIADDRAHFQSQVRSLTDRLGCSEKLCKELQDRLSKEAMEFKQTKEKHLVETEALQKTIAELRENVASATSALKETTSKDEAKLEEVTKKMADMHNEIQTLTITNEALLSKMKTMEQLHPEAVQKRVDRIKNDMCKEIEKNKEAAEQAIKNLEASKDDVEKLKVELDKTKKELSKLKKEHKAKKEEVAKEMDKAPLLVEPSISKDAELRIAIQQLESEVGSVTADKNSLIHQVQSKQYALDQLTLRNYAMAQEIGFLQQCIQGYLPTGIDFPTAIQQLQCLDVIQRELAQYRMHATNLEAQVAQLSTPEPQQ